jgi:ribonuclease HI
MPAYIFTDGACPGNQHANARGGYGVVLLTEDGTTRKELSRGYLNTTNNRMELRAVVAGLSALERECRAVVTTDSKYVADAIRQGWLENWQRNGWKNAQRKPVANRDLWEALLPLLARHEVEFRWVRGHSGHLENERCDALAVAAARGESGPLVSDEVEG